MLAIQLLHRLQRARHDSAVGDHGQIGSRVHDLGLAERNHVIRSGIRGAAIGFAIQTLVLEKQHRIVAANRRAQQAGGIKRIRRKHHAQAGNVREDALAALRVINRAAGQVSADRDANHAGRRERIVRPPAHHRQLVAQLHHRRPDVVEELDLDHRLQPAHGHADRAPDDAGLGKSAS